jgi:hypothetical protein
MTGTIDREEELLWFRGFVVESRWRFARTYVESYPHEYTLQRWGDAERFWRAILCIERWGVAERFWSSQRKYLYVDDEKYWHMGDPSSQKLDQRPGLINRTWLDVSRYRENARMLGYDDEALNLLVERWNLLLEKARRGSATTG